MHVVRSRIADSAAAFRDVVQNERAPRLESLAASIVGHWAYLVAVSVYAYGVGGEAAVGFVFLIRLVPAALLAPFAGLLDHYRREHVLLASLLARAVLIGAAAAGVFLDVDPAVVYALAVAATIATTPFRPAQAALTPALTRSPPGSPLRTPCRAPSRASPTPSAPLLQAPAQHDGIGRLPRQRRARPRGSGLRRSSRRRPTAAGAKRMQRPSPRRCSRAFAPSFASPRCASSSGCSPPDVVAGLLAVYTVVLAIDTLDLGNAGVGYLECALGVGAIVGGVLAFSLTGARRLSPAFMFGLVLWGAPLHPARDLADGDRGDRPARPHRARQLARRRGHVHAHPAVGAGLRPRACFGVIQMLWLGSVGIGAIVAPLLINWLGLEGALIVSGALLPALRSALLAEGCAYRRRCSAARP